MTGERALTVTQKRAIVDAVLKQWLRMPELRLGQLIDNALAGDLFYAEDSEIAPALERFVDASIVMKKP
jgi:hypothetical protein